MDWRKVAGSQYKGALVHWCQDSASDGTANTKWDTFMDISDYLGGKMELIGKHASQMPTAHLFTHGHRMRTMMWGWSADAEPRRFSVGSGTTAGPIWTRQSPYDSPLLAELPQNTR